MSEDLSKLLARERVRRWRLANPEKAKENAKQWRLANPEKAREYNARYWKKRAAREA